MLFQKTNLTKKIYGEPKSGTFMALLWKPLFLSMSKHKKDHQ